MVYTHFKHKQTGEEIVGPDKGSKILEGEEQGDRLTELKKQQGTLVKMTIEALARLPSESTKPDDLPLYKTPFRKPIEKNSD